MDKVKVAEVRAVFEESSTNAKPIETIIQNARGSVASEPLLVEGLEVFGDEKTQVDKVNTYRPVLIAHTCRIVNALEGTCDWDSAPSHPLL